MAARKPSSEAKRGTEPPLKSDRQIDEALEQTFPASDPPFFVGGREPDTAKADDPAEKEGRSQPGKTAARDRH
jgi:hypothetical protein